MKALRFIRRTVFAAWGRFAPQRGQAPSPQLIAWRQLRIAIAAAGKTG
jgi:hypothetical protein